jgi:pimeloyl-ACP methyl ester carboxylesterase
VSHLVYLAAFPVDADESCMACAVSEFQRAGITMEGPTLADAMVAGPGDVMTVTADGAAQFFFHDCDPAAVEWAVARLGPQPTMTLADMPTAVAWRDKPSTYVVCGEDRAVDPRLQRIVARRCTTTIEWPTSHSPFLSRPDLVADLLVSLAG